MKGYIDIMVKAEELALIYYQTQNWTMSGVEENIRWMGAMFYALKEKGLKTNCF